MVANRIKEHFAACGINIKGIVGGFDIIDTDVRFEAPCSIDIEIVPAQPLEVGAFTHINGGFIKNAKIGRYCSFARDVQIGHGSHPTDWLSVSPLQYWEDYRGWNSLSARLTGGATQMRVQSFGYAALTLVGNDVWLGNHATLLDGVSIGNGAVVAANSVVTRDVEPYAIVAGCPARIIRKRFSDAIIER